MKKIIALIVFLCLTLACVMLLRDKAFIDRAAAKVVGFWIKKPVRCDAVTLRGWREGVSIAKLSALTDDGKILWTIGESRVRVHSAGFQKIVLRFQAKQFSVAPAMIRYIPALANIPDVSQKTWIFENVSGSVTITKGKMLIHLFRAKGYGARFGGAVSFKENRFQNAHGWIRVPLSSLNALQGQNWWSRYLVTSSPRMVRFSYGGGKFQLVGPRGPLFEATWSTH